MEALWRWCHLRRDLGADSPLLFACEGLGPLSMARLTGAIRSALVALQGGNPEVKGKCFRRGGASGLVAQGLDDEVVANVAGWQTPAMARTYANARAQSDRRVAASRLMDPAAAASLRA